MWLFFTFYPEKSLDETVSVWYDPGRSQEVNVVPDLRLVGGDEATPAEARLPVIAVTHRGGVLLIGRALCGYFVGTFSALEAFSSCTGYARGAWQEFDVDGEPLCIGVDIGPPVHTDVPFVDELSEETIQLAQCAMREIERLGYVVREDGLLHLDL